MENKKNLVHDIVQELLEKEREKFNSDRDKYIGNYNNFCGGLNQRELDHVWYYDVWIAESLVWKISFQILKATKSMTGERTMRYMNSSQMVKSLISTSFIKLLLETIRR